MRATAAMVILPLVVLAGCASTAEYRHPITGDVQHCEDHTTGGSLLFGIIGGVVAGSDYADCKSGLEAKGYVRTKTGTGE